MSLSRMDERPALVVIDLQKGIVNRPGPVGMDSVVTQAGQLAKAFRDKGFTVVLVTVSGLPQGRTETPRPPHTTLPSDWAELLPELDQQPGDLLVTKHSPGAFLSTSLHQSLEYLGITQLFLAGVSTSFGVESTARSAYDLGYNVVFVSDAMTDRTPEAHAHSIEKTFPRIGEIATTQEVMEQLKAIPVKATR